MIIPIDLVKMPIYNKAMRKVIVISGGTDGLGKVIAEKLAPNHDVVILSPTKDKLEDVALKLNCGFAVCDITSFEEVEKAINFVIEKHGRIDCVINNAGIWIEGELESNDPDQIHKVLEVNTLGTMYMSKAVISQMKKQKEGRIINVISQAGLYAKSERTVYSASKWAITGFTKCLSLELAQYGISVTGLYPGLLKTGLFSKAGVEKDMTNALDPKEVAKVVEFIVETDPKVSLPEVGVKNINN